MPSPAVLYLRGSFSGSLYCFQEIAMKDNSMTLIVTA